MPTTRARFLAIAILFLAASGTLSASDWPRWLGPKGDNIAPDGDKFEPDLNKWKVAWKRNIGIGYSSIAVAGNRAYSMGHDGKGQETVYCLDVATGDIVWQQSYPGPLMPLMHSGGPNATPTVLGAHVITVSKDGKVFSWSADKGAKVWEAKLTEILGVAVPKWGFASSPVVEGKMALFTAGKVTALDIETGKPIWSSKTAYHPGYSSVVAFDFDGQKLIAAFDGKGLSVINAKDGEEVVRHPFTAKFDMTATTPVVLAQGKRIFISSNSSSEMLDFDGKALKSLWTSRDIKNTMNNGVIIDGLIYCVDGAQQQPTARMVCFNIETGKEVWGQDSFGYGNTIGIGKTILALTEKGDLVTVKAAPDKYTELGRKNVLTPTCWTTPTYGSGRIFVRNDKGDVVCLSN